jgi:tryptophanyl-tRNA synthetase
MSKSYNNFIGLLDDPELIRKKVSRIPTAALPIDASKDPDEDNLYKIWKLFLDEAEDTALRERYLAGGLSYKDAKAELTTKIVEFVTPIQDRFAQIDDALIDEMLATNAIKANEIAKKKVDEVYKLVGLR